MNDLLAYYACPGITTDAHEHAHLFDGLPTAIDALCRTVQGLVVHIFWAERYGLSLSDERKEEVQLRAVPRQLQRMVELDERPLTEARPPEKRLVGNCRDFSTLLCAMLRHQGVPARARCGFGTYFLPDHYEDHWVCEYWRADEQRWAMVDPQLDALQREVLQIAFDPLDMPPGPFVTGGQAWSMCRAGQADPDKFGIFEYHGMGFIRGDLIRDLLALNKVEILPWDLWGLMAVESSQLSEADLALLDRIAELTVAGDAAFPELRAAFEQHNALWLPPGWQP